MQNIKKLEIKIKTLIDSNFIWTYKTRFKWRWMEFSDYKLYEYGDDSKYIDFIASQKEWNLLVKKYSEERELRVYFLLDLSNSMYFWMWEQKKIDTLIEVFYLLAYSSNINSDRFWVILFDEYNYDLIDLWKWRNHILSSISKIQQKKLKFKKQKDFNPFNILNKLKIKKTLVYYISDKIDEIDIKTLKISSMKNDLVYINIFDSFENNLTNDGLVYKLWDKNFSLFVDMKDKKKKEKYILLRKKNINDFKTKLAKYNIDYINIDEKSNLYISFLKFFNNR